MVLILLLVWSRCVHDLVDRSDTQGFSRGRHVVLVLLIVWSHCVHDLTDRSDTQVFS